MTRVVNLRAENYDVYIGRPGKGQDGYFGNPIAKGKICGVCYKIHVRPGDTLACYRKYFEARVQTDEEFRTKVEGLRGKVLGCFCRPNYCHGDVIVEYLNRSEERLRQPQH